MAIVVGGLLTACGGGGEEEPTATTAPSSAQPTVEATVASTPVIATPPVRGEIPRNTDMSSPRTEVEAPAESTPIPATPSTSGVSIESPATPVGEPTGEAVSAPEETQAASGGESGSSSTGDGTSGAASVQVATPAAAATPGPLATPAVAASPQAEAVVPVVTSCDVQDVPPFTGDVTVYQLTVDLNFREGPGADCGLIGDGPLGEFSIVDVIGGPVEREGDESGEWVEVDVGDQVGWLAFEFLEPAE